MHRAAVTLCLMSRVISVFPFLRNADSRHASRHSRSSSVLSENGYVYNQFGQSPGITMYTSADAEHSKYSVINPYELKAADKLVVSKPVYSDILGFPDVIPPHTIAPLTYDSDYEISRARSESEYMANYLPAKAKSNFEKLKSVMHYEPTGSVMNDGFTSYSDFNSDDDDIRSSGGTMYDHYWPHIYHSPYEYEHNKVISDIEKAKDKRYIDNNSAVKPVHEVIENDIPMDVTQRYTTDHTTDNPISGNGPFFSFVLNDYFDNNQDEDPLSFKGIDPVWGKEFDHESYISTGDSIKPRIDRHSNYEYYAPKVQSPTTVRPQNYVYLYDNSFVTDSPSNVFETTRSNDVARYFRKEPQEFKSSHANSNLLETESGLKQNEQFNKHEEGGKKHSGHKTNYESGGKKYEGFKDFLDSFANKFGSQDVKKEVDYATENNADKGEKKKGFHRIYRKDEFQEDKEFYDNSNNAQKSKEKGSDRVHLGGSEALLRSQALAAAAEIANAVGQSGNTAEDRYENNLSSNAGSDLKGNKFNKFIDVAKQAAKINNARYLNHYET